MLLALRRFGRETCCIIYLSEKLYIQEHCCMFPHKTVANAFNCDVEGVEHVSGGLSLCIHTWELSL